MFVCIVNNQTGLVMFRCHDHSINFDTKTQ